MRTTIRTNPGFNSMRKCFETPIQTYIIYILLL